MFDLFFVTGDPSPPAPLEFCPGSPLGSTIAGPGGGSGTVVAKWTGIFFSGPLGPGGFPVQFQLCLFCAQNNADPNDYFFAFQSTTPVCDTINPGTRFYIEGDSPTEFFQISCLPFQANVLLNAPPGFGEDSIRAFITE